MDKILAIITLLLCGYFLLRIIKPSGVVDGILISYCVFTSYIILWGYILSSLNRLGKISSWSIIVAVFLKVDLALFRGYPRLSLTSIKRWYMTQFKIKKKEIRHQ
jgi:hypothetical protein